MRLVKTCRLVALLAIMPNIFFGILDAIAGLTILFVPFAAVLLLFGVLAFQAYVIRRMETVTGPQPLIEPVLRRIAHRPRRTMTPEDYRHLREMERGLGFEPDDPDELSRPTPVAAPRLTSASVTCTCSPDACAPAGVRIYEAGSPVIRYCGACGKRISEDEEREQAEHLRKQIIASHGPPPARTTDADIKDAPLATVHFAQLARVGRKSCMSACPLCEARDRHYPDLAERDALVAKLAGFEDDASLRDWIERGRFS